MLRGPAMLIRSARASDAAEIVGVHIAAIRELCRSAYEPSQIDAWVSGKRAENYLRAIANQPFIVAELDGAVVGFSELDPAASEVRAVYVRPDRTRRGIGGSLLQALESAARDCALTRVHLKASLNSIPFYEARGYVVDELTAVVLESGVPLPCASMHKQLSG
jgi:putative acetyltransferase